MLQTMVSLTTLFLVVICGAAATLGRQRCSREDANVTIAHWTQAFGIGGNGDVTGIIKGGTQFFVKYVGTNIEIYYSINTQINKSTDK